ncbi:ras-related protein Rab-21-like [Symsagittifera roscoffensis]|uniref:ras-related protein Rab-21-like n=1 Tax=Symsagittifera roscoffensis TaxID=84072 RepID=UPI00307C8AF3
MTSANNQSRQQQKFKVVLLGEGCVGKSSLVLRYSSNKFNENHESTVQSSFCSKRLNINNQRVLLEIWDTAGQERYHALAPMYYRESHGAVLVYDVTDMDSFDRVQLWVKELRKVLGKDVVLVIAGNKIDLEKEKCVSEDSALEYAETVSAAHHYTSAKLNKGIDQMFLDLTKSMLDASQANSGSTKPNRGINITSANEAQDDNQKRGCCGR